MVIPLINQYIHLSPLSYLVLYKKKEPINFFYFHLNQSEFIVNSYVHLLLYRPGLRQVRLGQQLDAHCTVYRVVVGRTEVKYYPDVCCETKLFPLLILSKSTLKLLRVSGQSQVSKVRYHHRISRHNHITMPFPISISKKS